MGFRRLLVEVSRQHSRLRPIKRLLSCSYHTSLKFRGDAGIFSENLVPHAFKNQQHEIQRPACSMMLSKALHSSDANTIQVGPTEAAKELHDKLL
ncbi:hypothetical protein HanXRQr2_Chr16g0766291 [Helianthus annuus]|uniref:Uncharacterized protein n=1 Tax=Helianthus annuus TaxID=4232 RepID=A0A251S1Q0_HELAN|nr:hypothetical protein HanXRQr2_Chr16g0766291 [Helianthus annuus]KAJ0822639.1 hypothetical protein HanPSC8_Chr16g0734461 [Helianthus annuus]